MAKEHPLLQERRILQTAIEEQLRLAQEMTTYKIWAERLTRTECDRLAKLANIEAGRLVQRLVITQEEIEGLKLD